MSANPHRRIEGKYEILQKIREGGMGAIYKVRHRLLDEVRVIKLMRPQLGDDAEFKARFVREARAAIKLRHPNIAHLYDFTIGDDDTAFIVMEFIDGKTLEELLKAAGPPPLGLALEIAQQSLRALGYLHARGFVHRDISPDNLMFAEDPDGNPQIKLIDLGIAKVLEGPESHLTRTGTFLGKLRYASPEQFSASGGPADARGDLYSFGLVLYELLTGVYPILGSDASSLIAGHLFRPPLPFEETDRQGRLPPGLRAVVLRALAKDPDQRYASARELAQDLAGFRQPGDLRQEDWRSLLARDLDSTASLPAPMASGTQHWLDEQFGPTTTPAPSVRLEVEKAHAQVAGEAAPAASADSGAPPAEAPAASADSGARAAAPAAPSERRDALDQLAPLLDGIRLLVAQEKPKEAGRLLRRAERLAPANPEVARLREQAAEISHRRAEERRRAALIRRRAAEIGKLLDRGDRDGSAALLAEAVAELGEAEAWQRLQARLEELRAEVRLAEVGTLLMRARQLWANGELQQAVERVGEAREIEPENPGVQALSAELETALVQEQKQRRRTEKLAQTVAAVAAKLDGGELDEASRLLDWAVVRFGATNALQEQWEHLEAMKLRDLARRVDELLAQARKLAASGDLAAAYEPLLQTSSLVAKTPTLQPRVSEVYAELARLAADS